MQQQSQPPLPLLLAQLQTSGRLAAPPFKRVPHSGLAAIEDVLDEAGNLKSAVLLGFTRDGNHLVSYTTQPVAAADGQEGYCLQLWSFRPGARCRRLWNVPLFRVKQYLESLEDEDSFMAGDDMLITIAETTDSGLLVVHGRSANPAELSSRGHHLANFLTLIPGPQHAGAAQLQVAHLLYHTAFPHTPFHPYHCLTQLNGPSTQSGSSSSSGGAADSICWAYGSSSTSSASIVLAVALFSGDRVQYVHAAVSRQAAIAAAAVQQPGEDDGEEGSSSMSTFLSPAGQHTPVQPPAGAGSEPQADEGRQQHQQQTGRPAWRPGATRAGGQQDMHQHRQHPQQHVAGSEPDSDVEVCMAVINCAHAAGSHGGSSSQQLPASISGSATGMAAVSCVVAPQRLDVEECLYAALQRQSLPPAALLDYAVAPVLGCSWQGQEGLLLLAVLRLARPPPAQQQGLQQQQQVHAGEQCCQDAHLQPLQQPLQQPSQQQQQQQAATRSACVLLHAAAAPASVAPARSSEVEWLEAPYPWHDDLAAYLVQQTAFAGLAFEKAPTFFADFLRCRYCAPTFRSCLPLVLTNRSVLGTGESLQHIAHPWLPQAILGYGAV